MESILNAFTSSFPSLKGVSGADVWGWINGDSAAATRIEEALDVASFDGEWPGNAYAKAEVRLDGSVHIREFVIAPYVGDRVIRISPRDTEWRSETCVTVDFTQRPSAFAARGIVELIGKCQRHEGTIEFPRLWNHPVFLEVEEDVSELSDDFVLELENA